MHAFVMGITLLGGPDVGGLTDLFLFSSKVDYNRRWMNNYEVIMSWRRRGVETVS